MSDKPIGLWHRFIAVFTPTFLFQLNQEKTHGKSWGFLFLSTFFLLAVPAIIIGIWASTFLSNFPTSAINLIPENVAFEVPSGEKYDIKTIVKDFELTFDENFEAQTNNLPDPMIMAIDAETEEPVFVSSIDEIDEDTTAAVFVIDTKERNVSLEDIQNFPNVLFLLHDKFIVKNQNDKKTEIIMFKDIFSDIEGSESPLPFTLNIDIISGAKGVLKSILWVTLSILLGIFYFLLIGFRLFASLLWGLLFWGIGAIVKIKDWDFERSFIAMLHFTFVGLLLLPLGIILGIKMFCLIVFVLLFGANFYEIKQRS